VAESQLLREANQNKAAFDLLGGALAKSPDQPDLLYDHALTAEKLDRFDVLEADLKRLIQLKPDHAHAYNALGYSFAERNIRLPEAKTLIEKALELSPEDFFIIDSMGWVLYRRATRRAPRRSCGAPGGRQDGEIGATGRSAVADGERDEARRIWKEASSPASRTNPASSERFALARARLFRSSGAAPLGLRRPRVPAGGRRRIRAPGRIAVRYCDDAGSGNLLAAWRARRNAADHAARPGRGAAGACDGDIADDAGRARG
jgi:tetratricopeptide (TPR) repeat protein